MTKEELLNGESENIEFKVQRTEDSSKYMKTVVAFANGKGGTLIFGIDDKTHEVTGIDKESIFREMDAITEAISDSCEPAIIPDIYLQTIDEKSVIVVEIAPGRQRPYYLKSKGITNGVYVRIGGTTRHADRDMSTEMFYEDAGRSYDTVVCKELTVSEDEIKKLCSSMKDIAIEHAKDRQASQKVRDVGANQLISWGLLSVDSEGVTHPTNGYIYLTGQDPSRSLIQCGVFKDSNRTVFIDKRSYTGPLWQQVEDAFQFVLRSIHLGNRLNGVYREDYYELPPKSIRELIINAVMNRSLLSSSNIQVAVFDNRLEITSPGGLMPGVTISLMKEGFSKIRNKALAHAFLYMNLIEEWGTGIPKLIQEMQERNLREPEFIDMESAFRVNLYRPAMGGQLKDKFVIEPVESQSEPVEPDNATLKPEDATLKPENATLKPENATLKPENATLKPEDATLKPENATLKPEDATLKPENATLKPENATLKPENATLKPNVPNSQERLQKSPVSISDAERKVLQILAISPLLTQTELAQKSGISIFTIKRMLPELRKKGLIKRTGSRRDGKWEVLLGDLC